MSLNKKKKGDSGSDENDDVDDVDYEDDSHSDSSGAEIKASTSKSKKTGHDKQEGKRLLKNRKALPSQLKKQMIKILRWRVRGKPEGEGHVKKR